MIETTLKTLIENIELHAKWLNTLSCLENEGARKIAACEHPTKVKEEMLKHASEEFRHAHYLKTQIKKVTDFDFKDYSDPFILGGSLARNYLKKLDLQVCRLLKKQGYSCQNELKKAAYILTTYAIELRAEELYPLYQNLLKKAGSKVSVSSIIHEEEEHLAQMQIELQAIDKGDIFLKEVIAIESVLFEHFLEAVKGAFMKVEYV